MKRLAIVFLFAVASIAQTGPSRWGSTKAFGFGSVDRSTLDNHIEIPIYTRPTLGRAQINLELVYDSNFWHQGLYWNGTQWVPEWLPSSTTNFGWRIEAAQSGQLTETVDVTD